VTEPDDRELDQYLTGDSKLSRRYRDASTEGAPPELDEAILAQARAGLKRKPPSLNRYLAPVALAASVMLGVNLAWNVRQAEPVPAELGAPEAKMQSRDDTFVPAPPPAAPAPERRAPRPPLPASEAPAQRQSDAMATQEAESARQRELDSLSKRELQENLQARRAERQSFAADSAAESTAGAAAAPQPQGLADSPAPLSEAQKIDRLIAHVAGLQGAVFIRNGKEYGPAEAAKHLQLKREKAGDRVKTADDFIRLCASHSSMSGEAYLIRFADGRTRTAEDVLRDELAGINGVGVD
jgi:hypothetical protein